MALVAVSRAIMPILIIEFLVGMYLNLFSADPAGSKSVNPFVQIFTGGQLLLAVHVIIGFLLLFLSLLLLLLSIAVRHGRTILLAVIGLGAMLLAFWAGIAFVLGGYSNDQLSYGMAVGFLLSFVFYGALAGTATSALASQEGVNPNN